MKTLTAVIMATAIISTSALANEGGGGEGIDHVPVWANVEVVQREVPDPVFGSVVVNEVVGYNGYLGYVVGNTWSVFDPATNKWVGVTLNTPPMPNVIVVENPVER